MKTIHWLLGAALPLLVGAASAQSSSFTVTPLRVDLGPRAPTSIIDVINTSPTPLTIQVQQRAWTQVDGKDAQGDTRDLILSPAIFTLQPGEKQVVRVADRAAPDATLERAYRVLVSEVPTPELKVAPTSTGFRVALRMDLPLFVAPVTAGRPSPEYAFDAARSRLTVRNGGTGHIRYTDFVVLQAGRKVAELPVFTVLAQGERSFELPNVQASGELRVQAESNAGPVDAAVGSAR
jgi:fimbrial chaperone protein